MEQDKSYFILSAGNTSRPQGVIGSIENTITNGRCKNNAIIAPSALGDKIHYAEKQSARSLRKEHCQCYAHNHQPPTAHLLAAVLEKIRTCQRSTLPKVEYAGAMPRHDDA